MLLKLLEASKRTPCRSRIDATLLDSTRRQSLLMRVQMGASAAASLAACSSADGVGMVGAVVDPTSPPVRIRV